MWHGARSLVGREPQLRILLDAAVSPPTLIEVKGEAGIGKSRLVRELLGGAEAGRRRMLLGHCHRVRERFTLGPVIEALRTVRAPLPGRVLTPLVGTLNPLLPELGGLLPPALEPLHDLRAQRHRTFRALRELLEALGPTVCVLEDLNWADAGTLDFLSFLLAEPPVELALVLTYRSDELDVALRPLAARVPAQPSDTTIELAPLSVDEVRVMAAGLLDDADVSRQTAMSLHARTGGVPFAIEELVRSFQERCHRPLTASEFDHRVLADRRVPPRVGQAVLERLARLGDDAGAVAHACAVVGEPATEEVLGRVAELTPGRTIEALVEALGAGLLAEHGCGLYGVRHALAAQAVYESIPAPRRKRLHLRAARALEAAPEAAPPAQIAHHLKVSGLPQWTRYAEAAADAAGAVGDDRTAAQLLEEALGATGLPRATRIRMASKLGDAALFARVPRQAIRILRSTLDDGRLPAGVRGELRLHLARLLLSAGDDAYSELVRAAGELRRRPRLSSRAHAILATWGPLEGDPSHRLAWSQRAIEAAGRAADPERAIEAAAARAVVLLDQGDPAGWRTADKLPWRAASIGERLELARACKYLAKAAVELGHHRRAESLLDEGDRIRRELGHDRFAVGSASVRVSLEWSLGAWTGLEEKTRVLMHATAECPALCASNQVTLGRLFLARGERAQAEEQFLGVLAVLRNAQTIPQLAAVAGGLATIELARGDARAARELVTMALDHVRRRELWAGAGTLAVVAVDVLLAGNDRARAEDVVRRFARELRRRDAPSSRAALAVCRGALAEALDERDVAGFWYARSEVAWRRLQCAYEAAQARERHGRCSLRGTDPALASSRLLGALKAFECLGAPADAARVRGTLRAHGITAPSRAGRKGYGSALSPREAEVAQLASRGASNREIAEALVISERTVESHMGSILKKLRVRSRSAIPPEKTSAPD